MSNAAGTVGTVRVDLEADWGDFKDDCERAGRSLLGFGQKAGTVAVNVAKAGAIIGAAGASLFLAFAAAGIRAAVAAENMQQRFDAAFGGTSQAATVWAEQLGHTLGYTTAQIEEQAASFQDLFAAIAPTADAAANASEHFTQLAADFAAVKNIDLATAVDKIRTAVTTGGQSMQQYGIDLSDAAVNARALREGLIKQGQTLNETGQQLVRAQILTEALAATQGEAKKSTDDLSNQQRIMSNRLSEAATNLGKTFLPALVNVEHGLARVVEWFTSVCDWVGRATAKFLEFYRVQSGAAALQQVNNSATDAAVSIGSLGKQAADTGPDFIAMAHNLGNLAVAGHAQQSWTEKHRADIDRIVSSYDTVSGALRDYTRDMEIARRAGLDMTLAQRGLAATFLEAAGDVKQLRDSLDTLPGPLRALAEQHIAKMQQHVDQAAESMRAFAMSMNVEFGPKSGVELQVQRLEQALQQGLITLQTYQRAKDALLGGAQGPSALMSAEADRAAESYARVNENIRTTAKTMADLVTGTKAWGDTIRQTILEFLKAKWITPFLENVLGQLTGNGMKGKGGGNGGLLGGVGQFIGSLFGASPAKKAIGGTVVRGVPYEVGERGRELFVPTQGGTIMPHGSSHGGTTINVYTPDANSFLASRRQVARAARRDIGV